MLSYVSTVSAKNCTKYCQMTLATCNIYCSDNSFILFQERTKVIATLPTPIKKKLTDINTILNGKVCYCWLGVRQCGGIFCLHKSVMDAILCSVNIIIVSECKSMGIFVGVHS